MQIICKRGKMKIAIGSDHVGRELKLKLMEWFDETGIEYKDFGAYSSERTNYPEYALPVAKAVVNGEYDRGILICGTGVGISISANKVHGVRCVCCSEPYSALLSRNHNNTNILAMGARVVGLDLAKMIVKNFLEGEYEGGRHQVRVDEIAQIEKTQSLG